MSPTNSSAPFAEEEASKCKSLLFQLCYDLYYWEPKQDVGPGTELRAMKDRVDEMDADVRTIFKHAHLLPLTEDLKEKLKDSIDFIMTSMY